MSAIAFLRQLLDDGLDLAAALTAAERYERIHSAEAQAALEDRRAKDRARQARRRAMTVPPDEWQAIRRQVFERDGYVCTYCSQPTDEPHCDHVIAVSRGGSSDIENLTTACPSCNASKGAQTVEDWLATR